jgi:hypothetical protein
MADHTMTAPPASGLRWSTASFSDSTDSAPGDLCALGQHLQHCQGGNRRLRALRRGVEAVHGFVAPRFVSTLALVAVLGLLVLALR